MACSCIIICITSLLVCILANLAEAVTPVVNCADKPIGWSMKVICPDSADVTCKESTCSSCKDCQLKFPGAPPVEAHVKCINATSAVSRKLSCAVTKCSYCLGCNLMSMKYLPVINGSKVAVCSNCDINETIFWDYDTSYNGNLGRHCRVRLLCQPEIEHSSTTGRRTAYRPVELESPVCRVTSTGQLYLNVSKRIGSRRKHHSDPAITSGFRQEGQPGSMTVHAVSRKTRQSSNLSDPPVVTSFTPYFGPQAGGTIVTIYGSNLSDVQRINIGRCECILEPFRLSNNARQVKCMTSACYTTGVNPLTLWTDMSLNSSESFRFKRNPSVLNITRTDVIDVGGIMVNFTGQDLGSSATPRITVSAVCRATNTTTANFTGECLVCDDEMQMVCVSPNLTYPDPQMACPSTPGDLYDSFDFVIGLIFDGYLNYSSLPMLPQFAKTGKLNVKSPPTITRFGVKVFDPLTSNLLLVIEGAELNSGSQKGDYCITAGKVDLGQCNCIVELLFSSRVTCRLPIVEPPVDPSNTEDYFLKSALGVVVTIGNFQDVPGSIVYIPLILIEVIVPVGLVAIIVALAVVIRARRRRRKRQKDEVVNMSGYEEPISNEYHYALEDQDQLNNNLLTKLLCDQLQSHAVRKESVKLEGLIGQGQFGNILRAVVSGSTVVAAKILRADCQDADVVAKFLKEAVLMKDLNHPNVISLYGVVLNRKQPIVLIQMMERGDLRSMLRKQTFPLGDQLNFCLQIANGMAYLASRKFIHRDLAARNCLLSNSYLIKIGDFGLAHELDTKDYYRRHDRNKPLPVKWMAPESLATGVFTTSSDVWSYGVVMWEIMARGCLPYADVSNYEIRRYLQTGRRLECPTGAPIAIHRLMEKCWHSRPSQRPSFIELLSLIGDFIGSGDSQEMERHYTKDIVIDTDNYLPWSTNDAEETESTSYIEVLADTEM